MEGDLIVATSATAGEKEEEKKDSVEERNELNKGGERKNGEEK
jgi:hypothetical protein